MIEKKLKTNTIVCMNKEIELKARVENPEAVKKHLSDSYGVCELIKKYDIYYQYPSGQLSRLRVEDGKNCVTLKRKKTENGIEINDELEFFVDDGEAFLEFLRMTGAVEYIRKIKTGYRYAAVAGDDAVTVELCEVSTLGWFIEIEKVIGGSGAEITEDDIEYAQKLILKVLHETGIPEQDIEKRYYSEMLLEL